MRLKDKRATHDFGVYLGKRLTEDMIIALMGDLGAGKTTLTQGIAEGMGLKDIVSSSTFTLINEYDQGPIPMYHFDTYRLEDPLEFFEIGGEDYLSAGGVSVIEWADRVIDYLPEDILTIELSYTPENERNIEFYGDGPKSEELCKELMKYEDTCL